MKVIAFLPVRGGSKSIPLKNIKSFCGEPLLYWAAKAAQNTPEIDEVIIATDSQDIKDVALNFNFSKVKIYNRLYENANDVSSTESVMLEYIDREDIKDEYTFILIQVTSPFLLSNDLSKGIKQLEESKKDSLLSCAKIKRFFWSKEGRSINYNYNNRPRRQDFEGSLIENGAFYINKVANIKQFENRLSGNIEVYEMPEYSMVEIDEPDDWFHAEYLMKKHVLNSSKKTIKLFLSDVDGVLTDAGMYYSENGDELKKFNTHDGKGFELLRNASIKTGIITSENTAIVERRANKLKVDYLFQGKEHGGKLEAAKIICDELNISLNEVAYIGDDVNCYELLKSVGCAACPNDALDTVKSIPNIHVLSKKGGEGVVREFVEKIISTKIF
ncbi:acylneuraminate cytidylyltransferase [Aestuariivivens insulae]|uniref:acylneuraminate cytidylyltransferase n=1 Tax=Aestuariivivens insulae TaxID=1621988 RepID=UPI001F57BA6E|nr:acylneuraminate cytidylyltransferase [Aestuariivivens insulae]